MSYELISPPILHCLQQRAAVLGHPAGWDWVLRDPVVGCFGPSLHLMEKAGVITLTPEAREQSRQVYWHITADWVRREHELRAILDQLHQAGIEVIPLKGAVLVETAYPRVGLRSMSDIDILVKPEDFVPAAEILIAAGMNPIWGGEGNGPFAFKDMPEVFWPLQLSFVDGRRLCIDLHQHLLAFHWFNMAFPFTTEGLWSRRITNLPCCEHGALGSKPLWENRFSPVDMLAHLCLHPAFHGFRDIKSFFDIDVYIRHLPEDWDWSPFLAIAKEWGIRNCAYHAFRFANFLFGTGVSEEVLDALDPGRFLRFQFSLLTSPQSILEGRKTLGKRFPPLVLFALIDRPIRQLQTIVNAIFPKRSWLRHNPDYHTLVGHWRFIINRLFREASL